MEPQINFHGHGQKQITKIIVIDPYFSSLNAGDKKKHDNSEFDWTELS